MLGRRAQKSQGTSNEAQQGFKYDNNPLTPPQLNEHWSKKMK
jgi:hypothetical protein